MQNNIMMQAAHILCVCIACGTFVGTDVMYLCIVGIISFCCILLYLYLILILLFCSLLYAQTYSA